MSAPVAECWERLCSSLSCSLLSAFNTLLTAETTCVQQYNLAAIPHNHQHPYCSDSRLRCCRMQEEQLGRRRCAHVQYINRSITENKVRNQALLAWTAGLEAPRCTLGYSKRSEECSRRKACAATRASCRVDPSRARRRMRSSATSSNISTGAA